LGQTRDVHVLKLISKSTIDETIYQLAQTKLKLDAHVSGVLSLDANGAEQEKKQETMVQEGDEALLEKQMKVGLLKKLQEEVIEIQDDDEEEQEKQSDHESREEIKVKSKYF
jgi:hypothetical protein